MTETMEIKKKKKGRVWLILLLCIVILLGACAGGGYLWFRSSPFPTALRLAEAMKTADAEQLLDCVEPNTAQKMRQLLRLTGMDADRLFSYLLSGAAQTEDDAPAADAKVRYGGYERSGDTALIKLRITEQSSDAAARTIELPFVRIDGVWYLSLETMLRQAFRTDGTVRLIEDVLSNLCKTLI